MNPIVTSELTLRQCWERYYPKDEMAPKTLKKVEYSLNRWERYTTDVPVQKIDHLVLEDFRQAMIDDELAPRTINCTWGDLRSILRRLGPSAPGNPFGLGIISAYPAMRPVKDHRGDPEIISQEDLSRIYIAARHMEYPRKNSDVPPCDWWRALIVLAYCAGFRRGTLWDLRWHQVDLDAGTVRVTASKTGKSDLFPLHPVAADHLTTIRRTNDGRVFRGLFSGGGGAYCQRMRELREIAQVPTFGLQVLRRTGATMLESACPGIGELLLQHTPRTVSDIHYLNRYVRLKDALEKLPIPAGWKSGPKVYAKRQAEQRKQAVEMTKADFITPDSPNPEDWSFSSGQFAFRGTWFEMRSLVRITILKTLATNRLPVSCDELLAQVQGIQSRSGKRRHEPTMSQPLLHSHISCIRTRLRRCLGLGSWNPIPCTLRGDGGAWTISIPDDVNR